MVLASSVSTPRPPLHRRAWFWWLTLLAIWLLATLWDRSWLAADHSIPDWDEADYLNSAVDHGRALGLLPGGGWPGWDGLLDLSPKIPPLASLVNGSVMALVGDRPDQAVGGLAVWHGLLLVVVACWGRQLVSPGFGLLAAALTALLPGLAELRLVFTLDLSLAATTTLALWLLGRWQAPQGGLWRQSLLAALAVAAAVLVKQSALLVLLGPCCWAALRGLGQPGRRLQALAALAVVLAVCLPWLHHNWITTIGGTNRAVIESAAAEGDPAVFSLTSLLWYPRLWPQQLGLPVLAIALIGGLIGLLPVLRDPQRRWAPLQALRRPVLQLPTGWPWLIGCSLSGWVLITLSPNKDPRYIAPLLPLLALLLARGWWGFGLALRQRGGPRLAAAALVAGLGSTAAAVAQPRADAIARRQVSPLPQVMATLNRIQPGQPLTLLVLPGVSDLNDHTATFYGRLQGGQVLARSLGRNPADHALVLQRAEWLLLATGDQGHRRGVVRQLSRQVRQDGRFERVAQWPWSKGRQVELWRRTPSAPPVPPFDRSFIAMASGLADGPQGLAQVFDAIGPQHQLDAHFLYQRRVEDWARQRLGRDPNDIEALWSLTLLAILQERPQQAEQWLARLARLLPDNPWPAAYRSAVLLINWKPWPAGQVARTHSRHGQEPVLQGLADLAAVVGGDLTAIGSARRTLPQAYARIDQALKAPPGKAQSADAPPGQKP
ncbi:glycosyltransferase family 39 protein [Synechococcus sp. CCY9202]|uniref:glycosyltransferase family 39 protein n=1 Tax=Synechococcus sp. CCY9202 TaxID=174698 RepID=UPI002B2195EA|nr:glycosyltransferase family 39 protein [Synechococcus sp. CCY9202]MEA5421781.1 glycosyltransferase family 39 protein [Synechococcus sp. CCY9202]